MGKQSKEEILKFFKKLSEEKNWEVNWEKVNAWGKTKHPRSFYTFVILKNGKKAFFKYPLVPESTKNFSREIAFLKYIEKNIPSIVPKIYDHSLKKPFWYLTEALDFKKGAICENENTIKLQLKHADWLLKTISQLHSLSKKQNFPTKLKELSFLKNKKMYIEKFDKEVEYFLKHLIKKKNLLKDFKFREIRKFLDENKKEIRIYEGKAKLIQGDIAPNNVFFDDKKRKAILLDWEWASISKNKLINSSLDFSNFYTRSWMNKKFQQRLLKKFISKKITNKKQIKATVIIQAIWQLFGVLTMPSEIEKGKYRKQHIKRIIESLNQVLLL